MGAMPAYLLKMQLNVGTIATPKWKDMCFLEGQSIETEYATADSNKMCNEGYTSKPVVSKAVTIPFAGQAIEDDEVTDYLRVLVDATPDALNNQQIKRVDPDGTEVVYTGSLQPELWGGGNDNVVRIEGKFMVEGKPAVTSPDGE